MRRWHERRLGVLVAGEAKRGKSTLVNPLLGRPVLPTGVIPVTAVATTVVAADRSGHHLVSVVTAKRTASGSPPPASHCAGEAPPSSSEGFVMNP